MLFRISLEKIAQLSIDESTSEEKYRKRADFKIKELLSMEKTYVEKRLTEAVDGYLACMEEAKKNPEGNVKIPADLLGGKDRIIFGNIRDLYEFHKK